MKGKRFSEEQIIAVLKESEAGAKTKQKRGSRALANLIDRPLRLKAIYKGREYRASLRRNDQICLEHKLYESPNQAARTIVKRPVDGWHFWRFSKTPREWVPLRQLKR